MRILFGVKCIALLVTCLILQACAGRDGPAPVTSVYTGKTIHDYQASSLTETTYKVQRGETLYSIAFRANLDVRELAAMNNLNDPFIIHPGQTLRLKKSKRIDPNIEKVDISRQPSETSSAAKVDSSKAVAKPKNKAYVGREAVKKQTDLSPEPKLPSNQSIAWKWPTENSVIAEFSLQQAGNKGIDFSGSRGDPVRAAAAGKVVYVGKALRGFGRLIILKHNDDFITAYAHNDQILVEEQQFVRSGQEIAEMGSSDADRVKLHFEVRFRGKSVNPRNYLPK